MIARSSASAKTPRTRAQVAREPRATRAGAAPANTDTTDSAALIERLSAAAVRGFVNIAQAWGLDEKAQLVLLGQPSRSTFYQWKRDPESARLSADTLERVSYLLGIYKALQILLPDAQAADGWVKRPNTAAPFHGRSALELMLAGQVVDLFQVRSYLDAQRGW